ncbi:hypothetical protein GGTG_08978 [Gaeumannomyces tritici R3-111a-1]|uniref:Uncharacterized protein n=1 Tax=Gaeumannomyces tritici (strain R3-111a-1) TaxID=644352 RepID=J3P637_GAET3|nr:hypothetical protein GGTG_08978 [Gaeumannomyces tritici R3-111a-1]EJT72110.1 hypothetical protein GGTG_08978 [Gaeumannomyces tritici R3-111a-1]
MYLHLIRPNFTFLFYNELFAEGTLPTRCRTLLNTESGLIIMHGITLLKLNPNASNLLRNRLKNDNNKFDPANIRMLSAFNFMLFCK